MPDNMPSNEQMIQEFSPTSTEPTLSGDVQVPESTPTPQAVQEFEYQANGKTLKEPIDTILKRASQGYNYAQHMQDVKQKLDDVTGRELKATELEKKYGEIDKYATENPDWNDHLHKTWQARFDVTGNQSAQEPQQAGIPSQFLNEFNDMKSVVESIKTERADQAYQRSFDGIKQTYPDIDFQATDPDSGSSLEQQVLNYASQNGINSFEPAFKAFYSDKLVERARVEARDQMAGDIKQRSKAGLLGTSPAPANSTAQMDYPPGYKGMSSDQLTNWLVDKYAT
tara:strand:- start:4111 stop:4959 length:849 start_codon:yes stop_codon:yes gene_type:complete